MFGDVTPSIRCDGCRYEAEDEGEVMVSMEDVMSDTMNFGATAGAPRSK